eukprot:4348365-Prymnesium_polylepis.1
MSSSPTSSVSTASSAWPPPQARITAPANSPHSPTSSTATRPSSPLRRTTALITSASRRTRSTHSTPARSGTQRHPSARSAASDGGRGSNPAGITRPRARRGQRRNGRADAEHTDQAAGTAEAHGGSCVRAAPVSVGAKAAHVLVEEDGARGADQRRVALRVAVALLIPQRLEQLRTAAAQETWERVGR